MEQLKNETQGTTSFTSRWLTVNQKPCLDYPFYLLQRYATNMRTTTPDLLLQEGCQGTDKLLLVDVFHCDTRHLHDAEKKLMHTRAGRTI